jgi:hypothetical protein
MKIVWKKITRLEAKKGALFYFLDDLQICKKVAKNQAENE